MPGSTQGPHPLHLQPCASAWLWSPGSAADHLLHPSGRWDTPGPSRQLQAQAQLTRKTISKILGGAFSWHDSPKPSPAGGDLVLLVLIQRQHPAEQSLQHFGCTQKAPCGIEHQMMQKPTFEPSSPPQPQKARGISKDPPPHNNPKLQRGTQHQGAFIPLRGVWLPLIGWG